MTQPNKTLFSRPKNPIAPDMLAGILSPTDSVPSNHRADQPLVEAALAFAKSRPQTTMHDPLASAILEYLTRTVPGFNKSSFCAAAIDRALQSTYPDLWAMMYDRAQNDPRWRKHGGRQREGSALPPQ